MVPPQQRPNRLLQRQRRPIRQRKNRRHRRRRHRPRHATEEKTTIHLKAPYEEERAGIGGGDREIDVGWGVDEE